MNINKKKAVSPPSAEEKKEFGAIQGAPARKTQKARDGAGSTKESRTLDAQNRARIKEHTLVEEKCDFSSWSKGTVTFICNKCKATTSKMKLSTYLDVTKISEDCKFCFHPQKEIVRDSEGANTFIDVPPALRALLPNFLFRNPSWRAGVYLIYNPFLHKVYVGQSENVVNEISRHLNIGFNDDLKKDVSQYGADSFLRISVVSEKDLDNAGERRLLEKQLIIQLQKIAYNRAHNPSYVKVLNPNSIKKGNWNYFTCSFVEGSRGENQLETIKTFAPQKGKSSIYIIIHSKTFRIYIGESVDVKDRIKRHRDAIHRATLAQLEIEHTSSRHLTPYVEMAKDIVETGSADFVIGCLEVFENDISRKDRQEREVFWKKHFLELCPNRLYNPSCRHY